MALVKVCCLILTLAMPRLILGVLTHRRHVGTWNLQGSSASTEAKWSNSVRQLVTGKGAVDVLALQEAGTPPVSAKLQPDLGNRLIDLTRLNQHVKEYRWNLGTAKSPKILWIYYCQNDLSSNRVNVALITRERADKVLLLRPPGEYSSARPILGVQLGKDNYFTIHASASGGGDAAAIVNIIHNYFGSERLYDHEFMILGDFNRGPPELKNALEREPYTGILNFVEIFNPTAPTHKNGKILDYCVIGQFKYDLQNHVRVGAAEPSLSGHLVSDHFPVVFTVTRKA